MILSKTIQSETPVGFSVSAGTAGQGVSDTAQGHKKTMTSRTVMMAGAGLAALVLTSCGQKPAPAAEATGEKPAAGDTQSMRVTRIVERSLTDDVAAQGRLVSREEAAVGSDQTGYRVQSVYVDEGDWVKRGQHLAKLDDTLLQAQIAQAEAQLATQKATLAFKDSQYDRAKTLTDEGAFSKEQLEQRRMESDIAKASLLSSEASVKEMKARQDRMILRAPVSGRILQRTIRPGDISMAGGSTPYFRIARDGLVELDAELPDSKLALLKEGDKATVTLASGEHFEGKVRFISPRVTESTSLGRARIELPFSDALRPGGFASATFASGVGPQAKSKLTVPSSAVRYESGGPVLMVVDKDNKVSRAPVKLGERTGDYVEIVEGPPANTRVLAMGSAFTLEGDVITPLEDNGAAGKPAAQP